MEHTVSLLLRDPEVQFKILRELTGIESEQKALEHFCVVLAMNMVQEQPALDGLCRLSFKAK